MSKFITFFVSSVYKTKLVNEKSKNYFLDYLANAKGFIKLHGGGFETAFFKHTPECDVILNEFQEYLSHYRKKPGSHALKIKGKDYWLRRNEGGDFMSIHHHVPDSFSGVWYLKAPKGCGDIVFQNGDASVMGSPNNQHFDDPHFWSMFRITPEENDLLLFPSHMLHYVEPSKTNEDRICLGFNVTVEQ